MLANAFTDMFISKVWTSLSNNNLMRVKILVTAMLESDTTIAIEVDGKPFVTYRYPTFADSKFIPLITNNTGQEAMIEQYANLIDTATETAGNVIRQSLMSNGGYQQSNFENIYV